jgi:hypothetical protein
MPCLHQERIWSMWLEGQAQNTYLWMAFSRRLWLWFLSWFISFALFPKSSQLEYELKRVFAFVIKCWFYGHLGVWVEGLSGKFQLIQDFGIQISTCPQDHDSLCDSTITFHIVKQLSLTALPFVFILSLPSSPTSFFSLCIQGKKPYILVSNLGICFIY